MNGLIHISPHAIKPFKVNKYEFNITTMLIQNLDIEYESDYTISYDNTTIECCDRFLGYSENYYALQDIPPEIAIFRPIKNEKHANIIIDMLEYSGFIDFTYLEVRESIINNKKKFSGWLTKNHEIIDGTYVKSAPSVPILKTSIAAKILFDDIDMSKYMENLINFLNVNKKGHKK